METCLYEEGAAGARRTTWIARALHNLAEAAAAFRADLSRPAMSRRVLQRLSTLSERELKDIGLTPHDVADAAGPAAGDAIALLIARRDARRRARAGALRPW